MIRLKTQDETATRKGWKKKKKSLGECKIRGTLVKRKGRKRSNVKICEESKEIKMNKTVHQ